MLVDRRAWRARRRRRRRAATGGVADTRALSTCPRKSRRSLQPRRERDATTTSVAQRTAGTVAPAASSALRSRTMRGRRASRSARGRALCGRRGRPLARPGAAAAPVAAHRRAPRPTRRRRRAADRRRRRRRRRPTRRPPERSSRARTEFGPLLLIEAIEVVGNTATRTSDPARAADPARRRAARERQAAARARGSRCSRSASSATSRSRMRKGSERGQVILEVRVVERGTIVLNRLWFGTSDVCRRTGSAPTSASATCSAPASRSAAASSTPATAASPGARDAVGAASCASRTPSVRGTRWGANGSLTLRARQRAVPRRAATRRRPGDGELPRVPVPPVRRPRRRDVRRRPR